PDRKRVRSRSVAFARPSRPECLYSTARVLEIETTRKIRFREAPKREETWYDSNGGEFTLEPVREESRVRERLKRRREQKRRARARGYSLRDLLKRGWTRTAIKIG